MPLQATSGAASYDAFGGGVPVVPKYIEEYFSTYLYSGNDTSQSIANGIDLLTKGGMVWAKSRTSTTNNIVWDTARGVQSRLTTNTTTAAVAGSTEFLSSFNTTGFTVTSTGSGTDPVNDALRNYVSWSWAKAPKFFDVVTFTGNSANRTITHNLGSTPGCIIIKCTSTTGQWVIWHRSGTQLNNFAAYFTTGGYVDQGASIWGTSGGVPSMNSTTFSLGTDGDVNTSGATYVAYLFAHDAGGFGLTGTDNVISCGSFTTDSVNGNASVNLGYEPQWLLVKTTAESGNWRIVDNMRGMTVGYSNAILSANLSNAESTNSFFAPSATGFEATGLGASVPCIYIAIRRGPMKVPTVGTSVFGMSARTGTGANATVTGGQTNDAVLIKNRGSAVASLFSARLAGELGKGYLVTSTDAAEVSAGTTILQANPWDVMDGVKVGTTSTITNASANTYINYLFKRAPSFMDVVCYTGTGVARTVTHNLAAVPELMIVKRRNDTREWNVYASPLGATKFMFLNTQDAVQTDTMWNDTAPTSSVFTVGTYQGVNASASTYVAYLFATCAGVSKVGSYTGNGTTQTIDCGFGAGGARFVLIKRTDAAGGWYVYDTARGMTVLTDPYLLLNTTDAEAATLGSVTTVSTGFALNSTILAAINVSAGTYIFLAIA
jgi:hypothetical protein